MRTPHLQAAKKSCYLYTTSNEFAAAMSSGSFEKEVEDVTNPEHSQADPDERYREKPLRAERTG